VEKGRGNHTRRFDVPLELEKLTFDAHPTELLPEQTRPATGPDLEKSHRLPGYGIIPRRG
jgi:hypothetical protein